MSDDPVFTFGIIIHNDAAALGALLGQLRKTTGVSYETLIVDNTMNSEVQASVDNMLDPGHERIIYRGDNILFSRSVNKIFEESKGKYIAILCGEHTLISDPTWVNEALDIYEKNERVGMLGHIITGPGLFHWAAWAAMAGRGRPDLTVPSQMKYIMKFPREFVFDQRTQQTLHGGVMIINKDTIKDIGPMDEEFKHALADSEYTLRCILHGWGIGNMDFIYSEAIPGGEKVPENKQEAKIAHIYPVGYKNLWCEELL